MNATQKALTRIQDELTPIDTTEAYREMLDKCYPMVDVGVTFYPSRVLEELDPIAFSCGESDYVDSQSDSWVEIDGEYYDRDKVQEVIDELSSEIQEEIDNLKSEISDLEDEDEPDTEKIEELKREIQKLAAEQVEIENTL